MSAVDLKEFVAAYLAEADEHLATSNARLLAIETALRRGDNSPRAVRDLFRALHTLKGLSAMVGVEPVVAIAHRMETVLRGADRAGGVLASEAIDVLLSGLRAMEQRVRALGRNQTVADPPAGLLEAIESLDSTGAPVAASVSRVALDLEPTLASKLTKSEIEQITRGVVDGRRALRIDFVPSPARAESGFTINSVRERMAAMAEIVRVLPRNVPVSEDAPGGLAFALLVLTSASDAELAAAASADPASITTVARAPEPATVNASALADDIYASEPGETRRDVLRVPVSRVDDAMERLAALIVTRSRLARATAALTAAGAATRELQQIMADQARQLRDLRASILRVRMVRMTEVLDRVPLLVRGIARPSGKLVRLTMEAGATELDKAVADRIFPALVHLVRNAIDHGIESPSVRRAAGKNEEGSLTIVCTEHSSSRLEVEIRDDGGGIDPAKVAARAHAPIPETDAALLDLLCRPGFSTRDEVTTTSGRGMGMDIVRRVVVDQLGGELLVRSTPLVGSTFTLAVPLTVSIVDAFTVECSSQRFVVPVSMVEELIEIDPSKVVYGPIAVTGAERRGVGILQRRGEAVPLIELATALRLERPKERARKALVVRRGSEPTAFGLDRILGQQEAVVRPLEDPLVRVPGVSGATDLGDGKPTLVLDLVALSAKLVESRTEAA